MLKTGQKPWTVLSPREKDDLNLISSAWFDLFSGDKPKPTKYEMVKWLRTHKKRSREK